MQGWGKKGRWRKGREGGVGERIRKCEARESKKTEEEKGRRPKRRKEGGEEKR